MCYLDQDSNDFPTAVDPIESGYFQSRCCHDWFSQVEVSHDIQYLFICYFSNVVFSHNILDVIMKCHFGKSQGKSEILDWPIRKEGTIYLFTFFISVK